MGERKYDSTNGVPALELRDAPARTRSGTHRRATLRPVLEHPHPLLARPSVEVDPMDPRVVALANMLVAMMRVSPACVGLAAPQIGENVRLFAMNVAGHKKAKSCAGLVVLANPRIITRTGRITMREGCMSVPHLTGDVTRAEAVIVSGTVPGSGNTIMITADAMEARCLQHEIDHLDGVLFVDRVLDPEADLFVRKTYA